MNILLKENEMPDSLRSLIKAFEDTGLKRFIFQFNGYNTKDDGSYRADRVECMMYPYMWLDEDLDWDFDIDTPDCWVDTPTDWSHLYLGEIFKDEYDNIKFIVFELYGEDDELDIDSCREYSPKELLDMNFPYLDQCCEFAKDMILNTDGLYDGYDSFIKSLPENRK